MTGQVVVRSTPATAWIRLTTSRPSWFMLRACARTMTSYGPATLSAVETPGTSRRTATTLVVMPTSVWIKMYPAITLSPADLPRSQQLHGQKVTRRSAPVAADGSTDSATRHAGPVSGPASTAADQP